MTKKVFYYLSAILIGIGVYLVMSEGIDDDQELNVIRNEKQRVGALGQEKFYNSLGNYNGFFNEGDYVEFALNEQYMGFRNSFEIFVDIYSNRYKMLLVGDGKYQVYSSGNYEERFDEELAVSYVIFKSDTMDYYHAYYRFDTGVRSDEALFFHGSEEKTERGFNEEHLKNKDRKQPNNLGGVKDMDMYKEGDSFYEKWIFIDEGDSYRDLRKNVTFHKDFRIIDR